MKNKIILLFILFIASIISGCQYTKREKVITPDPAKERLALDSLEIIDSLVNLHQFNNSDKLIHFASHALSIATRQPSPAVVAKAYTVKGEAVFNNQKDSAYFYFSEALKLADQYKLTDQKPIILFQLSKIYGATFDYKMCVILLDSVIRLTTLTRNFSVLSNAYTDFGIVKDNLHDYTDAKRMFDTAYQIASRHSLFKQMGAALGNLARFENEIPQSIILHRRAIEFLKKSRGTEEAMAGLLINIGARCENPDSAITYYLSAIKTVDSASSSEVQMAAYNNMAYSYLDKKDFINAEKCLSGYAIPLAARYGDFDWLATLYDTYSDVQIARQNFSGAVITEKKAYKTREKAYDKQVTGQVRLLAALLDVKNKELKIKNNEQELQKKENKIRMMSLFFIIALLLVGSAGLLLLWIHQRSRLKFERQLVSSARQIIDLEENMKGKLSMELHDMTSPIYTSLLHQIETTEIPDSAIKTSLQVKLTELADRIRQISHKMSKVYIEQLSFSEIISGLCEDMQYMTGARIHLDLDQNQIILTPEKATHVVRIVQELLANGAKYVKKGEINLSISVEFKNLNIIYHDNGPGFVIHDNGTVGLGLTNIRERAKLIGGKAELETAPGKGTHWFIFIPL